MITKGREAGEMEGTRGIKLQFCYISKPRSSVQAMTVISCCIEYWIFAESRFSGVLFTYVHIHTSYSEEE